MFFDELQYPTNLYGRGKILQGRGRRSVVAAEFYARADASRTERTPAALWRNTLVARPPGIVNGVVVLPYVEGRIEVIRRFGVRVFGGFVLIVVQYAVVAR